MAVVIVGFFVTVGLVIWGGFAVFNYFAPPDPMVKMEALMLEAKGVKSEQLISCLGKAQMLLNEGAWLEGRIVEKLGSLKTSCLNWPQPLPPKEGQCDSHQI